MVSQLVPPIATSSTASPSTCDWPAESPPPARPMIPSTATARSTTSRMEGSPYSTSTVRMRSASTRPPANPANEPQSVPMATATAAELSPTVMLKMPPASRRASMSRPCASVPSTRPGM